jgi:hypothetical protein
MEQVDFSGRWGKNPQQEARRVKWAMIIRRFGLATLAQHILKP